MRVQLILTFTLSLLGFSAFSQAKEAEKQAFIIGERLEFHSTILNQDRILNIYLPNGYSPDNGKTYPVIYLLDGSKDEDFIHISGLVQFASFPWINLIQESIVIGIENIDRKYDFTFPTNNELDNIDLQHTGGSASFIQFIEKELQPYINSAYKVQGENTIIGQSLGGLLATEILAKKPHLFDKYIIVSPSLWWDDQSLLEIDFATYEGSRDVFVAVGDEGKIMRRDAKRLYKKLKKTQKQSEVLGFRYLKEQSHGDALHLGVYHAFEAMKMIAVEI